MMIIDKDKARASFKEAVDAFDWSWAESYAGDRAPGEPHRFAHEALELLLAIEEPVGGTRIIRECVLIGVTDESDVAILVTRDEQCYAQKVIGGEVAELTHDEVFFTAPAPTDDLKTAPHNDPVTITEPAPPPDAPPLDAPLGNNPAPLEEIKRVPFDKEKARVAFEKSVDELDWEFALTQFLALHKIGAELTKAADGPPTIESLKAGAELAFSAAWSLGSAPIDVAICQRFAVGVAEVAGKTSAAIAYSLQPDLPRESGDLAFVTKSKSDRAAHPFDIEKWKKRTRGQELDW